MAKMSRAALVSIKPTQNLYKNMQHVEFSGNFEIFISYDRNVDHKISEEEFSAFISQFDFDRHERLMHTILSQFFRYADLDSAFVLLTFVTSHLSGFKRGIRFQKTVGLTRWSFQCCRWLSTCLLTSQMRAR